jgi:hypothetical protein
MPCALLQGILPVKQRFQASIAVRRLFNGLDALQKSAVNPL